MPRVEVAELLAAGCHFGHLTRRWNPKMRPYIFMERNGIHIIDLMKTANLLDEACNAIATSSPRGSACCLSARRNRRRTSSARKRSGPANSTSANAGWADR